MLTGLMIEKNLTKKVSSNSTVLFVLESNFEIAVVVGSFNHV